MSELTGFLDNYEWEDWDVAAYDLGERLNILPNGGFPSTHKWVVLTNNPMGTLLNKMLLDLIEIGYLETEKDNELRVRRNPNWKLSERNFYA